MNDYVKAMRFMTMMLCGCVLAVWLGAKLDAIFHTTPLIMLILLAYVLISSMYLLLKGLSKDG